MKNNIHQFIKFHKGSQAIVQFLAVYINYHGITVACELVEAISAKFGCQYTCQWITVILKSAGLSRATRGHRRRPYKSVIAAKVALVTEFQNTQPGLCLMEALFMQGAGQVITDTLQRRGSE